MSFVIGTAFEIHIGTKQSAIVRLNYRYTFSRSQIYLSTYEFLNVSSRSKLNLRPDVESLSIIVSRSTILHEPEEQFNAKEMASMRDPLFQFGETQIPSWKKEKKRSPILPILSLPINHRTNSFSNRKKQTEEKSREKILFPRESEIPLSFQTRGARSL